MGMTLWWYLAILFAPCLINAVLQDADHYRRWGPASIHAQAVSVDTVGLTV